MRLATTIRIDKRYSAACAYRWLRRCVRLGANISREEIHRRVHAKYGW